MVLFWKSGSVFLLFTWSLDYGHRGSAQFTLWSFGIIVTPSCVTEATSLKGNYMSKASIINLHYDLVVSDAIFYPLKFKPKSYFSLHIFSVERVTGVHYIVKW